MAGAVWGPSGWKRLDRLRAVATIVLVFGTLLSVGAASGGEPSPPHAAYEFIVAFVDALEWAKEGQEKQSAALKGNPPPDEMAAWLGEVFTATKLARTDYRRASAVLEPFEQSSDEPIRLSAQASRVTYETVIKADEWMLGLLEQLLNGEAQAGTFTQSFSEARAKKNEAWKALPTLALPAATMVLVSMSPDSKGRLSRLRITKDQRDTIKRRLEKSFGPVVRQGLQAGQSSLLGTATGLYDWLSKGYTASDEPSTD